MVNNTEKEQTSKPKQPKQPEGPYTRIAAAIIFVAMLAFFACQEVGHYRIGHNEDFTSILYQFGLAIAFTRAIFG